MEKITINYFNKIVNLNPFLTVQIKTLFKNGFPIKAVTEYLQDLPKKNGKSYDEIYNTIDTYVNNLSIFFKWLDREGLELEDLTIKHLKRYLHFLKTQGLSNSTVRQYTGSVKRFVEWCMHPDEYEKLLNGSGKIIQSRGMLKGIIDPRELSKLDNLIPKKEKKLPKHLTSKEVETIRNWISTTFEDVSGYPYKTFYGCIYEILVGTGIRRGELVSLSLDSIEKTIIKGEYIYHLLVKNIPETEDKKLAKEIGAALKSGERRIPIKPSLAAQILRLKALRPIECNHGFLLSNLHPDRRGNPFTIGGLRHFFDLINNVVYGANLSKHVHPHMLRHSYGTELIEKEVPIDVVANLMGHAQISTTQIYLHISNAHIREHLESVWKNSGFFGGSIYDREN